MMNAQQLAAKLAERRRPTAHKPCHQHSGRCADARDHRSELRPCCRGHLRTLMARVSALLNELGVVWWADYGTLLGAVRNPLTTWADYPWLSQEGRETRGPAAGVVPHDKDADIGVALESFEVVRRRLGGTEHRLRSFLSEHSLKYELSVWNQTNLDLFFWGERPDGTLYRERYAGVDEFKGRDFPRDLLFPLSTVEWEGLTLPAPRDPEGFLAMRYGPNWRTPIPMNHDGIRRP